MTLREESDLIIKKSIDAVLPDIAVKRAVSTLENCSGKTILVAIGKAAWQMANTCCKELDRKPDAGIVITKYDHVKDDIGNLELFEAGHPIPDDNSFLATERALELCSGLSENDRVLFLVSGGGSALFEKPLTDPETLRRITDDLLKKGARINEINTIRKRLSGVKGGRFAKACAPAKVISIILSDIIGDPIDMIASGPAYPDSSTAADALAIAEKYELSLSESITKLLRDETPKKLPNTETHVTGSVKDLVRAAAKEAEALGYKTTVLTDSLECEARDAGSFLASIAKSHQDTKESLAFIAGGETIVHVQGAGKGGRNQELALSCGIGISGLKDTAVFSVGSDGTDGPTDAAGGYCDGEMFANNTEEAEAALRNNDAYPLLKKTGGLIITGPTGTNVNDVSVLLIKR